MPKPRIFFDVQHLYYLPQYIPVLKELQSRGITAQLVFYKPLDEALAEICTTACHDINFPVSWVDSWNQAKELYKKERPDWIVFGNLVNDIGQINNYSKSALMEHGIGPKACYYDVSKNQTTVRFVEGSHRLKRLQSLFPEGNFIDSGYAKLDPAFNQTKLDYTLEHLGLDPQKKTILYAPTFFPSSIESFPENFPSDLREYNIIVKPHYFSLTKSRYSKQKKRLESWGKHGNVYLASVEQYNLLPFMQLADLMLSDASSAIFEFAALDKPIIWCSFYALRWSYRGPFKFRLRQRLDQDIAFFSEVTHQAKHYQQVKPAIQRELAQPNRIQHQRRNTTAMLAGLTDGNCSARICDYLLNHSPT
jgi:hypothetical protein